MAHATLASYWSYFSRGGSRVRDIKLSHSLDALPCINSAQARSAPTAHVRIESDPPGGGDWSYPLSGESYSSWDRVQRLRCKYSTILCVGFWFVEFWVLRSSVRYSLAFINQYLIDCVDTGCNASIDHTNMSHENLLDDRFRILRGMRVLLPFNVIPKCALVSLRMS